MNNKRVNVGEVWKHYRGERYEVRALPYLEADYTPMVCYGNQEGEWVRPLSEFLNKFTREEKQ